jgi:biopolymer transport protein ExbB/TolQ
MGILSLLFLIMLINAGYCGSKIIWGTIRHETVFRHRLKQIKSVGLFTLIVGIFCQLIGLYQVFSYIGKVNTISPILLGPGLRITLIPTLYGFIIFLISYIIWFAMDASVSRKTAVG